MLHHPSGATGFHSEGIPSAWGPYPDNAEENAVIRLRSRAPPPPHLQVHKYHRCWSCLIENCCPRKNRSWGDICSGWFRRVFRNLTDDENHDNDDLQHAIVAHLALITAQYLEHSPGLCSWSRGLLRLRRKSFLEEEANFAEYAPPRENWPGLHYTVNLHLQGPFERDGGQIPLQDVARAAAHFAKFALAAYSLKMYAVMYPASTWLKACCLSCCLSEKRAFQHLSGVSVDNILYVKLEARPFKPAWWLCRDLQSDAVVIAIRGTFSPGDIVSDAFARQVQYRNHIVHEGVLASARWLHGKVRPKLEQLRDQNGGTLLKVVVTGHSLGGAVAALLAWMLRDEDGDRGCFAAQCFVYGAPLVVDWDLSQKMQRFVVGIIHHMDMIPRTGHKSLEDLRDSVAEVMLPPSEQRLRRLEAVLHESGLPSDPDLLRQRLLSTAQGVGRNPQRSTTTDFHDAVEGDVCDLPSLTMYNPGWQLHLQRRGLTSRCTEAWPILRKGMMRHFLIAASTPSPQYMHVVRPSLTMWPDHWPQAYLYVCEAFADRLAAQNGATTVATSSGEPALGEVLLRVADYLSDV